MSIYTDWQGTGSAHAMVVCGYYFNTAMASPYSKRLTLMDPNYSTYQYVYYSTTCVYRIGTVNYNWYSSVY